VAVGDKVISQSTLATVITAIHAELAEKAKA